MDFAFWLILGLSLLANLIAFFLILRLIFRRPTMWQGDYLLALSGATGEIKAKDPKKNASIPKDNFFHGLFLPRDNLPGCRIERVEISVGGRRLRLKESSFDMWYLQLFYELEVPIGFGDCPTDLITVLIIYVGIKNPRLLISMEEHFPFSDAANPKAA